MDDFLEECGAFGPLKIEVEEPGGVGVLRREFDRPFVLIGRDERVDVRLDHDLVSRRHTYLQVIDGRVFFVDLESRAGTVSGAAGPDSGWLAPGQSLVIGPYRVRAVATRRGSGADAEVTPAFNPLAARVGGVSFLPAVTLHFQSSRADDAAWRMNPIMALVGTSDRCKVRLYDPGVSRLHCALLRTPRAFWVVDLLGRTGTTVNGAPVRWSRLATGDRLCLGQVVIHPDVSGVNGRAVAGVGLALGGRQGQAPGEPHLNGKAPAPTGREVQSYAGPPPPAERVDAAPAPFALPVAPPAAPDPSLSLLLGHFGQMQQQMLDQFQQSMLMMMQMFGGMHRDQMNLQREQMDLIREEIAKLSELPREIAALKTELAARAAAAAATAGAVAPAPGAWPPARSYRPTALMPGPAAPAPAPTSVGAPARPVPPPAPGPAAPGAAHARPNPKAGPDAGARPPRPDGAGAAAGAEVDPTVHDWLNDRLAAIAQEQQTRWQRIMALMGGGGGR